MPLMRLKKLMKREVTKLAQELIDATGAPIAVLDEDGQILLGAESPDAALTKFPIELEGETLGWVVGTGQASAIAALLSHLAEREYEKRTLSTETLERYKEINLLYTISQKMALCLKPVDVAQLVIQEARKLITASSASVMLIDSQTNTLEVLAAVGSAAETTLSLHPGEGIAGNVLINGKGVIVNDVRSDPDFVEGDQAVASLICTPLQVEEHTFGVMNISSDMPIQYTAGDLKLATALSTQAAVSIENARLHAEQLERERIVKELEIARNIQQSLLPSSIPTLAGAEMAAMSLPAKEVGGDFYDLIPITPDALGLVIADVSGKGVPAALFMALSRALMRANSLRVNEVAQSVIQTNRLILECATSGLFVTLFYGIIEPKQRILRYVSAGHNPPILFRSATGEVELLEAEGIALGVIDEIELEEKTVTVEPGDVIVMYTDGVTESINTQEEEFGEARLIEEIKQHHALPAQELMSRITNDILAEFTQGEPQFDDFTMMVVKMV
ncbi:conserved hypothetical membrane protein, SpoIIE and 5TMR of 5TMR-LYT family [Candidatus Moduliflexus flocculans]|uniref:Conserved hypothetical membrane protein, SpoIIE and 5TMR of 5TMR-LYT family n=1 Tax=Candidatus Moduliflexus flocculans TaxID=1499966 RepID=A0A081BQY7_9BACT|nr:conserved hypothetical membrane protein, SpoIIE and 5TMR of 5TMR-LYT family [Candidatus Moduliflexus flocculans]